MEKLSGIYRIICESNGDYYYGSSNNIRKRWNDHKRALKNKTHYNPRMQRVWNEYGEDYNRLEVVEFIPEETLFEIETKYLREHVGKPHCMNIAIDAEAPMRGRSVGACSEETKEKIRQTLMGHSVSDETRKKISEAQIGKIRKPHPPITEETRTKMRESHLGIKYPNRNRGHHHSVSDETRKKISQSNTGKRAGYDARRKMSQYLRPTGFPSVKAPDGQIYNIDILNDFCKNHNLSNRSMSRMILGHRKTYKGWMLV